MAATLSANPIWRMQAQDLKHDMDLSRDELLQLLQLARKVVAKVIAIFTRCVLAEIGRSGPEIVAWNCPTLRTVCSPAQLGRWRPMSQPKRPRAQ